MNRRNFIIYTKKARHPRHFAMPICYAIIFLALLYNVIAYNNGFMQYFAMKKEYARRESELAIKIARVDNLENKTQRLHQDSLDLDLLDEEARRKLGYIDADEVVVYAR